MLVIAFDQASLTAYAIIDSNNEKLIDYGYKDFHKIKNFDERISNIKNWINEIIKEKKPEAFALEDIQFQKNQKTYRQLAELIGTLKNNFLEKEYLYIVITPTQWKGYCKIKGRDRKTQKANSVKLVKEKYDIDVIEDEADAIGICLYAVKEIKKIKV